MVRLLNTLMLVFAGPAVAWDWPQLLGPMRDGHAGADEKITSTLPPDGPRIVWNKKVGQGFAGPVVAGGRVIVFHRLGSKETVECLDAASGKTIWSFDYPTDYRDDFGFDPGPRAAPTIDAPANHLYTHGAAGMVHCLTLDKGERVWSVDTVKQFGSRKGYFGRASSPLIEGSLLVLQVGGTDGAGIIALDKTTGQLRWKATDDEAGYSSPTAASVHGRRMILALTREAVIGLNPGDGSTIFRQPFRASIDASVNAATPILTPEGLFTSASYGTGAALWKLAPDALRKVWANDQSLSNHYATSIYDGGFVYGFHGRQDVPPKPMLRCIELATGKVRWTTEPIGAGSVLIADGKLVVVTEDGELIIAPATPDGFKPTGRAQILGFGARAMPALSNGLLYARDPRQLVCVDLRAH